MSAKPLICVHSDATGRRREPSPGMVTMAALAILVYAPVSRTEVFELFPTGMTSDCNEQLENVWNSANPGDEIILNTGVYAQGCQRGIASNGTAAAPIVIRAAAGADVLVTRPESTSTQHNNIEISGSWMVIRGLRFQYGSAGLSFMGGSHHITFEDNEVFDTYDNAIRLNSGDTDSFVIRNNHIHNTGLGGSTGEGMYIGCHSGNCVASNHLIEGNYIHDLESQSGGGNDGIEIKFRSHSNIIRGNLIHDTIIGQDFPCIFVYGHGAGGPNIIEDNFVYNCGEAILVTADAIVRNNIVLSSTVNGIHINRQNPAPSVQNVTVVNNTVYGSHPICARLNIGSGTNVTIANNAFYCENSTAVSGSIGGATVLNNYVSGAMASGSVDDTAFFAGGSASNAFVDAVADDFHLSTGSILIDAGDSGAPDLPATDYDGNARIDGAAIDVGAFESGSGAAPTDPVVILSVDDDQVTTGDDVTLSWTISDATSCVASSTPAAVWAGAIAPQSGSQRVSNLQADVEFTLSCDNLTGMSQQSVSVRVDPPVVVDPEPTLSLSVSPNAISAGQSATVAWTSTDASACEGLAGITGPLATNDSQTVNPNATITYALLCSGAGGSVMASAILTVTVSAPPGDDSGDDTTGTGATGYATIVLLSTLALLRRRRMSNAG